MEQTVSPLATAKFKAYHRQLLEQLSAMTTSEIKRARYELALMEKSRFAEINGIVHHYHDSGPAEAEKVVVLIHGWDCWWMWWHHVIRALNGHGIRTVAYDMRGHGWSDSDSGNNYHIDCFTRDLAALVDRLGLDRIHIAAFSFGPFVALDYMRSAPDRVVSATFFNFGYLPNSPVISAFAPAFISFMFNKVLRNFSWWLPPYLFVRLVLSRNTVMQHDILIGFRSLELCAPEAIEQTATQITSLAVTESLPDMVRAIDVPILFVAGEGDVIMSSENARKLQQITEKGRYVCVPECGHLITLELPDTASELIIRQVLAH